LAVATAIAVARVFTVFMAGRRLGQLVEISHRHQRRHGPAVVGEDDAGAAVAGVSDEFGEPPAGFARGDAGHYRQDEMIIVAGNCDAANYSIV
jgi:hypothetical protein